MKAAVIYASTTGNTESMANAIKEAVEETAEAAGEMKKMDELTEIKIFITDS